ncbi:Gfo/Idh/MocA family oxidoreductase [Thermostilla marina]
MRWQRRRFLGALAAAPVVMSKSWAQTPSRRVRVAVCGCGWRGGQLIPQFAGIEQAEIVAVCDPDTSRLAEKLALAKDKTGTSSIRAVRDIRRVIDADDVDAIVLSTPNHWHALATIWGLQAGKHVYVEKPVAHDLWESHRMVEAAAKYGKVVQGGTHRRSFRTIRRIMERIAQKEFGNVRRAHVVIYRFRESIGRRDTPLPIPEEVDYNLWSGPAQMVPLYRNAFHYDWHWMWETGNGELGNNGSHMLDLARWTLQQEGLAPRVVSIGGRYLWNDAGETPNTQVAFFDYRPAPLVIEVRNLPAEPGGRDCGKYRGLSAGFVIECDEATIQGTNGYTVLDSKGKIVESAEEKETDQNPRNFIEAVMADRPSSANCPMRTAHFSCGLALQGNISHRIGRQAGTVDIRKAAGVDADFRETCDRMLEHLERLGFDADRLQASIGPLLTWDDKQAVFVGPHAEAANRLLRRTKVRPPFVVPEDV